MFVYAIDKPWAETPFPIQGFMIKSLADASRVQAYCYYVYIDVAKGASPMDLSSAASRNSPQRNHSAKPLTENYRPRQNSSVHQQGSTPPSFVVKPYIYNKTVELAMAGGKTESKGGFLFALKQRLSI